METILRQILSRKFREMVRRCGSHTSRILKSIVGRRRPGRLESGAGSLPERGEPVAGKLQSLLLAVLIPVLLIAGSCAPKQEDTQGVVRRVKLARPLKESSFSERSFPGIIREAAELNLAFRVAGPIQKIYVKEGDYIRQGALIAQIDRRDYEIQAGVYEAQYSQMKGEYDRLTELNSRKSVADNDYEKAVAGEKMLRMQLQNARDQLNDTQLFAPFSGYIQSVKYEPGEMVNAGMTVATLIDVKSFLVEVDLPMSFFLRKDDFSRFSCSQPLAPEVIYPLQWVSVQMKANNSQLYRTTFRLDPKLNPGLAPGMTVSVKIGFHNGLETPLLLPISALFSEEGKSYVWKYEKGVSAVIKTEVNTGDLAGDAMITILSGVQETDDIVVAGVHVLREGMKVEPLAEATKTNVGGVL